jgi:dTMP kinase
MGRVAGDYMAAYPPPVCRLALRMNTVPQTSAPQRSTDMADPAASIDAEDTRDIPEEDRSWRGKFITFEGGEGTGKSTQAALLAQHLQSLGLPVLLTREPGGSPGAEMIRHVLLSGAAEPFGPEAEAMLFAAARGDHVRCAIEPALAAGRWVVCDRFADSTRIYQGVLGQVDQRFLNALDRVSVGDLRPDFTLILDAPVKVALERAAARRASAEPDRFESQDLKFHEKLREAFLTLALEAPERCVIIRANAAEDDVAKRIWQAVDSKFKPAAARAGVKSTAS